jgi:hypothetical protein
MLLLFPSIRADRCYAIALHQLRHGWRLVQSPCSLFSFAQCWQGFLS